MSGQHIAVALPRKPSVETCALAEDLAAELGCEVVERNSRTVAAIIREGYDGVIAVGGDGVSFHQPGGIPAFFHHPGMAKNRISSIRRGEPETLVRAAKLEEGMSFLDCTLGKGTDATVAAHVLGDAGRVVGIEASPVVAALVRRGLKTAPTDSPMLRAAMARIEVLSGHNLEHLPRIADDSFDVVYFDPFFEQPVAASHDIEPLRAIGTHEPVSAEAIEHAKRIARSRVVHKLRSSFDSPATVADWPMTCGKRRVGYRVCELP